MPQKAVRAKRTKSQHLEGPGEDQAASQVSVSWATEALEAGKARKLQVYQFRRLWSERDEATHIS